MSDFEKVAKFCDELAGNGYSFEQVQGCGNEGDVADAAARDAYRFIAQWCRKQSQAAQGEG